MILEHNIPNMSSGDVPLSDRQYVKTRKFDGLFEKYSNPTELYSGSRLPALLVLCGE